jgi:hypothetical protein
MCMCPTRGAHCLPAPEPRASIVVMAADTRVVRWVQNRVARYQKPGLAAPLHAGGGAPPPPILPGNVMAARAGEKEYSVLETSKIQAACGLTDAQ